MDGIDLALARAQEERRKLEGAFDTDLYGAAGNRFDGYVTSIPASGDDEDDLSAAGPTLAPRLASYTGYDAALPNDHEDHATNGKSRRIIDREDEYRRRRLHRFLSPDRHDAFAAGEAPPDPSVRTYADAMRENMLQHRKEEVLREIAKIKAEKHPVKRRGMWDATAAAGATTASSAWDDDDDAPDAPTGKKQRSRWDDDETPKKQRPRWDDETPENQRSRWDDETTEASMETPLGAEHLATPTPAASQIAACGSATPELYQHLPWERDIEERSRPLSDDELDAMLPQKGYKILEPPASYQPKRNSARRILVATPTPLCTPLYAVPEEYRVQLRFLWQM
jgi:splicing factor 3B subunit 1